MRIKLKLLATSLTLFPCGHALAITWEVQAERLVRVNAAVLDSAPVIAPLPESHAVGGFVHMSLLPKVNATVGVKKEKAPSPPVHSVPSIQGTVVLGEPAGLKYGLGVYAGFLPAGAEKVFGLDAKFTQWQVGLYPEVTFNAGSSLTAFVALGFHLTKANIKGHITDPKSNDTFDSTSQIYHFSAGISHKHTNIWTGFLVGMKKTKAKFFIDLDGATIETVDTLQDATMPVVLQASLGWKHKSGFGTALSEIFVPSRLFMPRLSLTYDYVFGAAPAAETTPGKPAQRAPGAKPVPAKPTKPAPGKVPPAKAAPVLPQGTQGGSK